MDYKITFKDHDGLFKKLKALGKLDLSPLFTKQRANMWNRSNKKGAAGGGTPFLSGDLKKSRFSRSDEKEAVFGYNAEHAPHVEFGHRIVRNGRDVGFAKGQYFLKSNYEAQKKIFESDIKRVLREAK